MKARHRFVTGGLVLALALGLLTGCGDDNGNGGPQTECPNPLEGGGCAGVTLAEICSDTYCTADAACTNVLRVSADAAPGGDGSQGAPFATLAEATAAANPGDCIALAPGTYDGATLKGGVSLLGAGAEVVTIKGAAGHAGLAVQAGSGGLLRGFTVSGTGSGIGVSKVPKLRIEQVRVDGVVEVGVDLRDAQDVVLEQLEVTKTQAGGTDGHGIGILLAEGSSATVKGAAVSGCGTQGIFAHESGLVLESSLIKDNLEYGVCIVCTGSACTGALASQISEALLDGNTGVGLLMAGGKLTASKLEVARTLESNGLGRGVEAQGSAAVQLSDIHVHATKGLGMVFLGSTGTVADSRVEDNDDRGIWVQDMTQGSLLLKNNTMSRNRFAGLGAMAASGLKVEGGTVSETATKTLLEGSSTVAGADGLHVVTGSEVEVLKLKVEGNARVGVLFDASKGSVRDSQIGNNTESALVVQNGTLDAAAFSNNVDQANNPVQAATPSQPYAVTSDPIQSLPLPVP
jgi:hypothetical protein